VFLQSVRIPGFSAPQCLFPVEAPFDLMSILFRNLDQIQPLVTPSSMIKTFFYLEGINYDFRDIPEKGPLIFPLSEPIITI
jgi:hypothetical protein